MIEKFCHVPAYDPVHGQNVFVLDGGLEKTAALVKQADISPEIAEAIDALKAEPGHRYVLVNGIGAGEFWSSNKNGDYFPESGLKHAGDDYGYRTFLDGHNFIHHENKDPKKAVGTVKAAHYNERMHRVELLIDTDLEKLKAADPDLHEKVANGQPVDVSMGSRCDYDVCSKCSNKAATRAEYCAHLKTAMNQINGDGSKNYAYTPHPKFFDISYVTKGADVTAKALHYMDKAASVEARPARQAPAACPDPAAHLEKAASTPAQTPFPASHRASVELLEAVEPSIPAADLAALAKLGFNKALSTASHFGLVLRPEEYQYLALAEMGQEKLARILSDARQIAFDELPVAPAIKVASAQVDPDNFDADCAAVLAGHVEKRSVFEPYFSERLKRAKLVPKETVEKIASARLCKAAEARFMTPELAAALALGYLVYRRGIPEVNIDRLKKAIHDPALAKRVVPVLVTLVAAGSVVDRALAFNPPTEKAAGVGTEVLLPVAGTYLYSAYAKRKAEQGRPISGIEHMFAQYPLPLSVGAVAAGQALKHRMKRTIPKNSAMISPVAGEEMKKSGGLAEEAVLAMGAGIYRPRLSGLAALLADTAIVTGIGGAASLAAKATGTKSETSK